MQTHDDLQREKEDIKWGDETDGGGGRRGKRRGRGEGEYGILPIIQSQSPDSFEFKYRDEGETTNANLV